MIDPAEIIRLRRALKNARVRALFWSGNPSFTGKRFKPHASRKGHDEQYELAMCDIDSLAARLEELTGHKVKRSDPRAEFRERFSKLMTKI